VPIDIRAILASGAVAALSYILLPFTFLGVLGLTALTSPDFVAGYTQGAVSELAKRAFGGEFALALTVVLILALILSCGTLMASSSRALYQGSIDGVFPKYLSRLNSHRAPVAGMWTDVIINSVLLLLGNPLFVLAAGAVNYILCISMDLVAVRLLRDQFPDRPRHYRAPDFLVNVVAPALAVFNVGLILFGANTFAANALWYGLGVIGIVIIIFGYRHYFIDKGEWPEQAKKDLGIH
jgi:amino acid transporter